MSSLELCDRLAKAISTRISTEFRDVSTTDTVTESAELASTSLSVWDASAGEKRQPLWFDIRVVHIGERRYSVDVWARLILVPWEGSEGPDTSELVKRYRRPDVMVEETSRYSTRPGGEPHLRRRLDVSVGDLHEEQSIEKLESEAFLTEVAGKASGWLVLLRDVSRGAEGNPKASAV